ncbi:DUF4336 domain-containing protein [Vibrio sp. JC009]|uniref:hypothetical protein n=1 Tax=Vibrio sp. JC009 TaxID=2912314 RepID=UPI0023AFAB87|nr:hypothetical protein [Vibrio sp. JC009]WED24903.1 DUF4336 domain-containing protein [Vibrio sp. JC009]
MELNVWEPGRIWYADMLCRRFGLTHIHRMVLFRISEDSLIVHSPIELTTSLQKALSKIGKVRAVIVPSPAYHQHLSEWWLAYPQALFYATPTTIQKRTDLNFDGALSGNTPQLWKGELYQTAILGLTTPRKMVFCDPVSRTLVLTDNLLAVQPSLPMGQKLATWVHGIHTELKMPYSDKRHVSHMPLLRASVQEIMTWPFDRILTNNGLEYRQDAKSTFYQAFWWAF